MDGVDNCPEEDQVFPRVKLTEGLDVRELLDTKVTTFQIDVAENDIENDQHLFFDKEEVLQCVNLDCIRDGSDEDDSNIELGTTPFQKIASKMTNLTEDGKVKKREIRPGSGCVIPKEALVSVHYNAYVEYGDEPYDSTWLRGQPANFRLERGCVIVGLDIAIASMKKGETSRFLIHPDMGYGKLGCPPRIPQNAELLFEVELLSYSDDAAAEALEALSMEDCKKATFDTILTAARAEHSTGNDFFKKDQISGAINKYRKAVNLLEKSHLKDEDEEAKQQHMLLKLYINLAVCYNKQKASRKACIMCRNALDIQPINAKALFNFGRALLMLSDFHQAKCCLLKAQRIEPENQAITSELKRLDEKQKTYNVDVRMFSQRAFCGASKKDDTEPKAGKSAVSADFENSAKTYLVDFVNDGEKIQMPLPAGLTAQEEFCIRNIAQELGLIVRSQERRGEKMIYISKPEPEPE